MCVADRYACALARVLCSWTHTLRWNIMVNPRVYLGSDHGNIFCLVSHPFPKINSKLFSPIHHFQMIFICASAFSWFFPPPALSSFSFDVLHDINMCCVFFFSSFFLFFFFCSIHGFAILVYFSAAPDKIPSSQKMLLIFCNYLLLITFFGCFDTNQRWKLIRISSVSFEFIVSSSFSLLFLTYFHIQKHTHTHTHWTHLLFWAKKRNREIIICAFSTESHF